MVRKAIKTKKAQGKKNALPLDGIKVLDFSWAITGPAITRTLADYGATVVKIESLKAPDVSRLSTPFLDRKPGVNRSAFFANYNRNKMSATLNLSHARGAEIARKLALWADVVVESFTPGNMKKWGLDYENLVKIKPDIIMLSTCSQGQTGPGARLPGYGFQLVALTGYAYVTGWPDRVPAQPYGAYTDFIGPPYGVLAIVSALEYRHRTGKGQYLDLSQLEASVQPLGAVLLDYEVNGRVMERQGNRDKSYVPHGAYPCQGEDRWVAIAVTSDKEWKGLCQVMGTPEWTQESRFDTFLERKKNEDELNALISQWTSGLKAEEAMEILQRNGVPAGVVSNPRDLREDPQLNSRGHYWEFNHSVLGKHFCDAPASKFSKTSSRPQRPVPLLGEHHYKVYKEFLGLSDEEISELVVEGVIEVQ